MSASRKKSRLKKMAHHIKTKTPSRQDLTLEILLTTDRLADKVVAAAESFNAALRTWENLLRQTSIKLTAQDIRAAVDDFEAAQEKLKSARGGGVFRVS